jgi:hypothetical protein
MVEVVEAANSQACMYTSYYEALAVKPWTWENQSIFDKRFKVQMYTIAHRSTY